MNCRISQALAKTIAIEAALLLIFVGPNAFAATFYVSGDNTDPSAPYSSWTTAATNIQQAANIASEGDSVIISNGVYAGGVVITSALNLLSVSGPEFTVLDGGGAVQCIWLTTNASLTGFTLSNGVATYGGGVWCASSNSVLTNCVLTGNSAPGPSGTGGGAFGGTLYQCRLVNNSAVYAGGGVAYSTLYHCILISNSLSAAASCKLFDCELAGNWGTNGGAAEYSSLSNCILRGNSAWHGGATYFCELTNCTIWGNSATSGGGTFNSWLYNCIVSNNTAVASGAVSGGWVYNSTVVGNSAQHFGAANGATIYNSIVYFNNAPDWPNCGTNGLVKYSCTIPLVATGTGNITNDPCFIDYAGGNLRLLPNSRCIDSGNNNVLAGTVDFDGRPRVSGPLVDMGAYEFQPGVSGAFIDWLGDYGLAVDGTSDFADPDGDGMNNHQEWVCGTNPTNAFSVLRLISVENTGPGLAVKWQSVAGIAYFLERSPNVGLPFVPVASNIPGQASSTTCIDTNVSDPGPFFYRVGVTPR